MVNDSLAEVFLAFPEYGLTPEYSLFLKLNKLYNYVASHKRATKTRFSLSSS